LKSNVLYYYNSEIVLKPDKLNHRGHKEKTQRSQRNKNQGFNFVPFVIPIAIGTLWPLW